MSLRKMTVGIVCKNIYARAMQLKYKEGIDLLAGRSADELGSGAADMTQLHNTRKSKVSGYMMDPTTKYKVPIMTITTDVVDQLEYLLFGHDKEAITLLDFLDIENSPLAIGLERYWKMLDNFEFDTTSEWFVLAWCGVDGDDLDVQDCARCQVTDVIYRLGSYSDTGIDRVINEYNYIISYMQGGYRVKPIQHSQTHKSNSATLTVCSGRLFHPLELRLPSSIKYVGKFEKTDSSSHRL